MNLSRIPCKSNPMPIYTIPDTEPIYFKMPLTFKSNGTTKIWSYIEMGTPNNPHISGRVDGGQLTAFAFNSGVDNNFATLTAGQTLQLYGNMTDTNGWDAGHFWKFHTSGANLEVYGNIKSLLNNSDTLNNTFQFGQLFNGCTTLVDASKLVLPFMQLSENCYRSMFYGCSQLTAAPILPATHYVDQSNATGYDYMFYGCSNLQFIEFGLTSWGTYKPSNWFSSVNRSGYFIKPSELTSVDSKPSNFTVLNRVSGSLQYTNGTAYTGDDPYAWYYGK